MSPRLAAAGFSGHARHLSPIQLGDLVCTAGQSIGIACNGLDGWDALCACSSWPSFGRCHQGNNGAWVLVVCSALSGRGRGLEDCHRLGGNSGHAQQRAGYVQHRALPRNAISLLAALHSDPAWNRNWCCSARVDRSVDRHKNPRNSYRSLRYSGFDAAVIDPGCGPREVPTDTGWLAQRFLHWAYWLSDDATLTLYAGAQPRSQSPRPSKQRSRHVGVGVPGDRTIRIGLNDVADTRAISRIGRSGARRRPAWKSGEAPHPGGFLPHHYPRAVGYHGAHARGTTVNAGPTRCPTYAYGAHTICQWQMWSSATPQSEAAQRREDEVQHELGGIGVRGGHHREPEI